MTPAPNIRVNLVPREIARRARRRRQRLAVAGGFVALVAGLAGGVVLQSARVAAVEEELQVEQALLDGLTAEQAELAEFADLELERTRLADLVTFALGEQVAMAGVLQDVAAVMPHDAALEALTVTVGGAVPGTVGTVTATAQSTRGHAPGLERLLISFEKVDAFTDLYFGNSVTGEDGVVDFDFDFRLGPEVRSHRYADGVPEVLR